MGSKKAYGRAASPVGRRPGRSKLEWEREALQGASWEGQDLAVSRVKEEQ